MAENATYTLLVDLNQGVQIGKADLSSANAPTGQINLLNQLPTPLSKLQSIEIITYVFEDLASDEAMDLSSLSTATLEGRLINSTDSAVVLDSSLTISGEDNNIATAVVDKDVIPAAWTAGVVRLTWTFEDASTKCVFYQDQIFTDPAGTQNGTAVTGFITEDASTTVQPTSNITFSTDNSVTDSGNNVATVRNDCTTNMSWEYDNTVAKAAPGAGLFRLNHATVASATEIYIDDLDKAGIDMGGWLTGIASGANLRFGQTDDPTGGELFTVTSSVTDETGYWTLVVVHVTSGTTGMADGKTFGLTIEGVSSASTIDYGATELATFLAASPGQAPDFTSIPSGYDKLTIEYQATVDDGGTGTSFRVIVNADSTATNYHSQRSLANNGSNLSQEASDNTIALCSGDGSADIAGTGVITIIDYDNTTFFKQFNNVFCDQRSNADTTTGNYSCIWDTTNAAVTRLRFDDASSNGFNTGSWFKLYGWKKTT